MTPASAKTPGEVHCYNDVCHRVKSLDEMHQLVGSTFEATASFYDIPERDRFNTGTYTSSGERFDAWSESHTSSSVYPDGTELLLWNPKNGRASHVRVNDFGPFYKHRTIDVTRGVADKLDFAKHGVTNLKVVVIWAPDEKTARYSRRRVYPPVSGYLGIYDDADVTNLAKRLIAEAPARNGIAPPATAIAAATGPAQASVPPVHSLTSLPAYAHPLGEEAAEAMLTAEINNTPRFALTAAAAPRPLSNTDPIAFESVVQPTILISATSPSAIEAATQPMTRLQARELETVVASAPAPEFAPAPRWLAAGPDKDMWQHILLALGLLSAAAASWRTRQLTMRSQPALAVADAGGSRPQQRADVFAFEQPSEATTAGSASGRGSATLSYASQVRQPLVIPRADEPTDEMLVAQAASYRARHDNRSAEVSYRQLLARREHHYGINHPLVAQAERMLADCLRELGRYGAAEPYYRRALAGYTRAAGAMHPAVADVLDDYAVSLLRQGRASDAKGMARQALAIRRVAGIYSREYAVTLTIVAEANRAEGNLVEAEADHRNAWNQFTAVGGRDCLDAAAAMMSLGTVMSELGHAQAAEQLLNAGAKRVVETCGPDHPATATAYALLGDVYQRAGQLDVALDMHGYARDIRTRLLGPGHPDAIESQLVVASILTDKHKMGEGRWLLDQALGALSLAERHQLGPQSRTRRLMMDLIARHDLAAGPRAKRAAAG